MNTVLIGNNPYEIATEGSTWLKWDLHIHTPETKLNNCYKATDESDAWDTFIKKIDESDVNVFGITDYFSIDNYEKFIEKYFSKEHKGIKKTFFPNIEFRLDVSVNKKAEEVNIHVIFDNETSIDEIKRFLDHLKTNISDNGRNISCSKLSLNEFEKAAININELKDCLTEIFGNKKCYIIGAAANNQGLRADTASPRKMNITDNIERECDFLFGSNSNKEYYLETNRYENGEFSPKKPVVSGSDSHSFEDIDDKLGKGQFCTWIKSLPTFNGLRQIIFEPEDRVLIKITEPDYKEPHNIINSICIEDYTENIKLFGKQKIFLNKNLNTIIGGKSSGKSLLLYSIARSIDVTQLNKIHEKFDDFKEYNLENVKFTIEWADRTINTTDIDDYFDIDNIGLNHKITYIPQLYINHLAEKNGREELNNLIDEILLNNDVYKTFKMDIDNKILNENNNIQMALNNLIELRNELISISDERKTYSSSEVYNKEIEELTAQYKILQMSSSFTEDEATDYKQLKSSLAEYENKLIKYNNDKQNLNSIINEIKQNGYNLYGNKDNNSLGLLYKYSNKMINSQIDLSKIIDIIKYGYSNIIENIERYLSVEKIEENIKILINEKVIIENKLKKYDCKISSKSELTIVIEKIEALKIKKAKTIEFEEKFNNTLIEYKNIKSKISEMLANRTMLYKSIKDHINQKMKKLGLEIELSCNLLYKTDNFKLFDYINKQFNNGNIQLLFDEDKKNVNFNYLPNFFLDLIKIENNSLLFTDKTKQPLKVRINLEAVYKALVEDHFYIEYDVTYKGDNLLKMSPGKKGTVLLILFLELSTSENPIFIDQPEDNLDNRTIYDLLCQMVKSKKKIRQIIIVTHNANLVVNTDAENVIVANQEGQDNSEITSNRKSKFEYINGPIELSFINKKNKSELKENGIKQHICDILEGGSEAFKLRERKYGDDK